jgi:hypothetical protein
VLASLGLLLAVLSSVTSPTAAETANGVPDRNRSDAGQLDASFSPDAPAGITGFSASRQFVDVAAQRDGKVVAVSDQGGDFYIARFNVDGSPRHLVRRHRDGVADRGRGGCRQVGRRVRGRDRRPGPDRGRRERRRRAE